MIGRALFYIGVLSILPVSFKPSPCGKDESKTSCCATSQIIDAKQLYNCELSPKISSEKNRKKVVLTATQYMGTRGGDISQKK
ncbi:hypothetical protein GCM10020331_010620 [Ectobacillus funiculus]